MKRIRIKHRLKTAISGDPLPANDDNWNALNWELVYDPDGLYQPNKARFDCYDVEYGLAKGAFSPGTLLVNRKSERLLKVQ